MNIDIGGQNCRDDQSGKWTTEVHHRVAGKEKTICTPVKYFGTPG